MVRSAIQVSGLSELSSLVSSVFALLFLHCCLCCQMSRRILQTWSLPVFLPRKLPSGVLPFSFSCSFLHFVEFSGSFFIPLLPQSDFRDLLTDPVADYYKHQSYQTLDQTDRRCISKLSSLNTDTQNVYIKGIRQRHVTRCT